jgi:hypothetical protein
MTGSLKRPDLSAIKVVAVNADYNLDVTKAAASPSSKALSIKQFSTPV